MNYLELIPCPPPQTINKGLTSPSNNDMYHLLGYPMNDGNYDPNGQCQSPNNPALIKLIETNNAGPFKVTGLMPAISSLKTIFAQVKNKEPELYVLLSSAGMLCARYTKKSKKGGGMKIGPGLSNHSWGTAIDIKIGGVLDQQGSNTVQTGLWVLSSYFNAHGWYWGAAFSVEDGMHFEVSLELLNEWKNNNII